MSLPSFYNTGTATVAAGSTAVTGQGTSWGGGSDEGPIFAGDLFGTHKGAGVRIASVNSNTSLTLAYPWQGGAQTAAGYEIQIVPSSTGVPLALRELIALLKSGNVAGLAALNGAGGNKMPRFTGAGTWDTIDSRNVAALAGLTGAADRQAYFTGLGTMELTPITPFARTFQTSTGAGGALANLGAGARGIAALQAGSASGFLLNSGISIALGTVADDAFVVVDVGNGTEGAYLMFATNTQVPAGIITARTHTGSNGAALVARTGTNFNVLSGSLSGTTGPDGALNVGVHPTTPGSVWVENRLGNALPFYLHIFKTQGR